MAAPREPAAAAPDPSPPTTGNDEARSAPTTLQTDWIDTLSSLLVRGGERPRIAPILVDTMPSIVANTLQAMTYFDYLVFIAFIVALARHCKADRGLAWYRFTTCFTLACAALFFLVPSSSAKLFLRSNSIDVVEVYVLRLIGACLFGFGVIQYRLSESAARDDRIYRDVMLAHTVTWLVSIPTMLIEDSADALSVPHRLTLTIVVLALLAVGSMWHIGDCDVSGNWFSRRTPINTHLTVFCVANALGSLLFYGFPNFFLSMTIRQATYSAIAIGGVRKFALILMAYSVLWAKAVFWSSQRDKQHCFVGHALAVCGTIVATTFCFLSTSDVVWPRNVFLFAIALRLVLLVNDAMGYRAGAPRARISHASPKTTTHEPVEPISARRTMRSSRK